MGFNISVCIILGNGNYILNICLKSSNPLNCFTMLQFIKLFTCTESTYLLVYIQTKMRKYSSILILALYTHESSSDEAPGWVGGGGVSSLFHLNGDTKPRSTLKRCRLTGTGIAILNLRRSVDRLRLVMGILIPIRRCVLSQ